MSIAIVPGSFDPITLGHLEVIKYAAAHYGEVVVAVMHNFEKQYLFSPEERTEMAKLTVEELPNVRTVCDSGYLVDLYRNLHADAVVKGIRNEKDAAYEKEQEKWNIAHCPGFQTVYVKAEEAFADISSSLVREKLGKGTLPANLLAPKVIDYLKTKGFQNESK